MFSGLETLSENFKDFFDNKESCDVTLKVKDKEYKAHRIILMARSSVFAANFSHNVSNGQTCVVNISDCDPDSFGEFLKYLYCGRLDEFSFPSAMNLYFTSNKFDVGELKAFCIEYLTQNLTVDNVCEVAAFADKFEEMRLFSAVQDFFNKNICDIFETSDWECLMKKNFQLGNKLLKKMSKAKLTE